MDLPEEAEHVAATDDLFSEKAAPSSEAPSEGIFADMGDDTLDHIGEVLMPNPLPTELAVQHKGWMYVYKLDRRYKEEANGPASEV